MQLTTAWARSLIIAAVTVSCAGGTATTTGSTPAAGTKKSGELEKLMRTKMNTSYSQLVFLVFHSENFDFPKITQEASGLAETVQIVRKMKPPVMVQSDAALSVYMTYNDTLQRESDRFVEAVSLQDGDQMQTVLGKIGQTCNSCHNFFRVEVADAPSK